MAMIYNIGLCCRVYMRYFTTALVLLYKSDLSQAYTDFRGTACVNPTLKDSLPSSRTEWGGLIELTMECDEGYDMPLNSPPTAIYTCRPDGTPWQPTFIPDCNVRIDVSLLEITVIFNVTAEQCKKISTVTFSGGTIHFGSGDEIQVLAECEKNPLHKVCTVKAATAICTSESYKLKDLKLNLVPPLVYIKLASSYSTNISWADYTNSAKTLGESMSRSLTDPPQLTTTILGVECDDRTIGVLQEGVRAVCRGCSLGHYIDIKQKKCVPCPPGFYADEPFSKECKICPVLAELEEDSPLWSQVKEVMRDRAFSIALCPFLFKNPKGQIEVKPSDFTGASVNKNRNPGALADASRSAGTRVNRLIPNLILVVVGVTIFVVASTHLLKA